MKLLHVCRNKITPVDMLHAYHPLVSDFTIHIVHLSFRLGHRHRTPPNICSSDRTVDRPLTKLQLSCSSLIYPHLSPARPMTSRKIDHTTRLIPSLPSMPKGISCYLILTSIHPKVPDSPHSNSHRVPESPLVVLGQRFSYDSTELTELGSQG